jgi:hypothetical protein
MVPREMTNRKSIFPLQPAGVPSPKSGTSPRSRAGSVVVSALPPPEPLSSVVDVPELLELDEDPLDEPSGTVVIPGVVVNADESEVGA